MDTARGPVSNNRRNDDDMRNHDGRTGYRPGGGNRWRRRLDRNSVDDSAILHLRDLGVVILFVCASVFPRTGLDLFCFVARDTGSPRVGPLSFLSLLRCRRYPALLYFSTTAPNS